MNTMHANDRAWVATKKGLFELRRRRGGWAIEHVSFLGEPVSMCLPPAAGSPRMFASLTTGHYGTKVWASDDAGRAWTEVATPTYPPQPEGAPGPAWKLGLIWSMERSAGTLWAGTLPGGLFRSTDDGASWQLVESLWHRPERLGWFGGGYPDPGIHSICPHPQRDGELLLGISCGGAWSTRDGGAAWSLTAQGMRADFMPPAPHRALRSGTRRALVPAPRRHLAIHRQRRELAGSHDCAGLELRFRRRRAPARSRHRVVRAGAGRPVPRAGGRRDGRQPHARRRQDLRDAA
jgi:hypothetical protein